MPIIQIDNVSKIYGQTNASTIALSDVSLAIEQGEFVALVGPSGCGKSTLLRLIADLDTPTKGEISVNAKTPHAARLTHDYGFVFQSPTLYEWRTIVRNAELPLEVMGRPKGEWQGRVDKMLSMVGLATSTATTLGSSPAACSSGRPSPAPSPSTRPSCLWTNPSAPSTSSPASA